MLVNNTIKIKRSIKKFVISSIIKMTIITINSIKTVAMQFISYFISTIIVLLVAHVC